MHARDVMQTKVITATPETSVREIAALLLDNRISAVPIVDRHGAVVGIVSEGDLMRRPDTGTGRHASWWLSFFTEPEERALAYIKSHGGRAADVMTREVVGVSEDASLEEIAEALERHQIKRVPVLRDGKLVGIVSRANLLHGLVARQAASTPSADDRAIKSLVDAELAEAGVRDEFLSVVVSGGVVHVWGAVRTDAERRALEVALQNVPGVKQVRREIRIISPNIRSAMWAM